MKLFIFSVLLLITNSIAQTKLSNTYEIKSNKELKQFLKDKGVEFEAIDVSQDEKSQNYIMEKTGKIAVPVTEIDGEIVVSFDKAKIMELLDLKD